MAGAVIASSVVEEEGTSAAEDMAADALMQAIEAPTPQQCVVAAMLQ
jgi:hypothetical protein